MRRTTNAAGSRPRAAVDQSAMVVAEQAQEIGAAALAPAHIGRVIDEAGKIGVLEVDAHRQQVMAPAVVLDEAAGEVGPGRLRGSMMVRGSDVVEWRSSWHRSYAVAPPISSSTISGGTPNRTGMIEQPRPPDTIRWRCSVPADDMSIGVAIAVARRHDRRIAEQANLAAVGMAGQRHAPRARAPAGRCRARAPSGSPGASSVILASVPGRSSTPRMRR